MKKINPDLMQLYPILSKDVSLIGSPPNQFYLLIDRRRMILNTETWKLLSLSDGSLSIYEIIENASKTANIPKEKIGEDIYRFFTSLEKDGVLQIQRKKVISPKVIETHGSHTSYYPYNLSVELTSQCNLRCRHCYADAHPISSSSYIKTDQLLEVLDFLYIQGLRFVELTGGEPLLHPDFLQIFKFCASRFPATALLTNGTLITHMLADEFAHYKQKIGISISLDGSTAEIHDAIRGLPGAFEKTIKGIKLVTERGIYLRISMTVYKENYSDLENTILLSKDLGANNFSFVPHVPFGRAQQLDRSFSYGENSEVNQYFLQMREKYGGFIKKADDKELQSLDENMNCGAGYCRYVIGSDGTVRPCVLSPKNWFSFGNILSSKPDIVFSHPLTSFFANLIAPKKEKPPCVSCSHLFYCGSCWLRGVECNYNESKVCSWYQEAGFDQYMKPSKK